jgi:iron complex transport system substrate-binding protein
MSLNPCIDAILVEVAAPSQIVSISHYSHDPRASSIPPMVARRFRANAATAEEVIAARPDLVLLGAHVAPATQAAIRSAGVRVAQFGVPASIAESRAQVRQVAGAVGQAARGEALVARIDAALAGARAAPGAAPVPALIRMGGGLVPGAGTLADELLGLAGFRNMSARYGLASWDVLPLERLLADPPRVLLTERAARASGLPVPVHGLRVADLPERLLHCAGPNLIEAAGRLAAIRRGAGA